MRETPVTSKCLLMFILAMNLYGKVVLAQSQPPDSGGADSYRGTEYREGSSSFGPDTVDLLQLGLGVRQELSPAFRINDLPYQVIAYYSGSGADIKWNLNDGHYAYYSPETLWGPLGVGWNVHMGKLLSSGVVDLVSQLGLVQCGFDDDKAIGSSNFCNCTGTDVNFRRLFNTIVEPNGTRHPMNTEEAVCNPSSDPQEGNPCPWRPDYSTDYSFISADVDANINDSNPSGCHATKGWRTPDGTFFKVNRDGLVERIEDLSGNWVEIDYFDTPAEFPACPSTDPNCSTYGVSRSKLYNVRTYFNSEYLIPRDLAWPLKEIRDSMGRYVRFTLTSSPIGGKYRIETITSFSPSQEGPAVYTLVYKTGTLQNFAESRAIEGNGAADPCGSGTAFAARCFAPELRTSAADGHEIQNVAFLAQIVRPDGTTVEFDYHPWGDLRSIRLPTGGVIEYQWKWETNSQEGVATRGIKLARRLVYPEPGSAQIFKWEFDKNPLPDYKKMFGGAASASYLDLDRTIMKTPEGNEIAYRFNDFGELRNVKVYAGTAFHYLDVDGATCSRETCITPNGWPSGRLLREINRWFDQGRIWSLSAYPIYTNLIGQAEYKEVDRLLLKKDSVNTRIRQEDVIYFDDAVRAASCSTLDGMQNLATRDWRYDLRGDGLLAECNFSTNDPRKYFPYSRLQISGWQGSHGYRRTLLSGSTLGFVREEERNLPPTNDPQASLYNTAWFRSPISWKKVTESIDGVVTGTWLTEYEYDQTLVHKVRKEIQRKKPQGITPNPFPYQPYAAAQPGDVERTYLMFGKRPSGAALDGAPYGLPNVVTSTGGDPRSLDENAPGNSEVTYEETMGYSYGTPSLRKMTGVSWRSLDAPVVKNTGHVDTLKDPAEVLTKFTYDLMGRTIKVEPGGPGSGEDPEHLVVLTQTEAPPSPLQTIKKVRGEVTVKGSDNTTYEANSGASYLRRDFDGLGRVTREERKLENGSKVERHFFYGFDWTDGSGLRAAWDRVTKQTEWFCVTGSSDCPRPSAAPATWPGTVWDLQLADLSGMTDPFLRYQRETAADGATRTFKHSGLNSRVRIVGIQGKTTTGADLLIDSETVYMRDSVGRLRIVDSPVGGADAVYGYDLFDNLTRASLVGQVQFPTTPPADATSGLLKDRFAVVADPAAQVRSFVYTAMGRLKEATNPESGTVHYHAYDPAGNLLLSDDENGTILWREYDRAGRLTLLERCTGDPATPCTTRTPLARWTYHNGLETARGSSLGKLLTVESKDDGGLPVAQQEFYYQGLTGRLSEERVSLNHWTARGVTGPFYAVKYAYSPLGQLGSITYPHPAGFPFGATVATYNSAHGILAMVTTNRTGISATLAYHPSGSLKRISHGNGTAKSITADDRGRVRSISVAPPSGTTPLWSTGTYLYDGGGNIYQIGDGQPSPDRWDFRYDAHQRLVSSKLNGYAQRYEYDPYGNMTLQLFDAVPAGTEAPPGMAFQNRDYTDEQDIVTNQIQDLGFSYDGNGNLRDAPPIAPGARAMAYDYDGRNRLTAAGPVVSTCTAAPCPLDYDALHGVYEYAASGLRVMREDRLAGWTTFYFRDASGEVLSEFWRPQAGGTPAWSRDYIQGAGKQLAIVENGPPAAPGGFAPCSDAPTINRDCNPNSAEESVKLDWRDNLDADIYGYRVYRGASAADFQPGAALQPLSAGILTMSLFYDTGASSLCPSGGGAHCYYAVTAVDRSGKEGPYSPPLAIRLGDTTAPGDPRTPRVETTTATTIALSWSAPSGTPPEDFLGYYVYRRAATESVFTRLSSMPTTGTAFGDLGLVCSTTYYYQIKSVDTASNESGAVETSGTTSACPGGGGGDGDKKRTGLDAQEQPDHVVAEAYPTGFALSPHQSVGQSATDWVGFTLHTDHLGSIRRITDASGVVTVKHDYFPFGKEIGPIQKSPSAHRFTGHDHDQETDLEYMQARYYSASSGRFITVDLKINSKRNLVSPYRWNLYSYALTNPLKYIDRDGFDVIVPQSLQPMVTLGSKSLPFRVLFALADSNPNLKLTPALVNRVQLPKGSEAHTKIDRESSGTTITIDLQTRQSVTVTHITATLEILGDSTLAEQASLLAHELFGALESQLGLPHNEELADRVQRQVFKEIQDAMRSGASGSKGKLDPGKWVPEDTRGMLTVNEVKEKGKRFESLAGRQVLGP